MTTEEAEAARQREFFESAGRGLAPPGLRAVGKTLRTISSFFSQSLLREESVRRDRFARRFDPRARLVAVLLFLVSVSFARTIPALAAHAPLPFLALAFSRTRPRDFLAGGFLAAVLFTGTMALPATLNLFHDGTIVLPLVRFGVTRTFGPWRIPATLGVTREGLLTAATFLLRVLPSVAAVLWLTLSTLWTDLLRALRALRVPPIFLQIAGMTVRYTHVLLRAAQETNLGKRARTLCRAPLAAEQRWTGSRIAASWEKSLNMMEEVDAAMRARGFSGDVRFPPQARLRGADKAFVAGVVLFCCLAHLAGRLP